MLNKLLTNGKPFLFAAHAWFRKTYTMKVKLPVSQF
jgi:hypothetical protein